MKKRHLIYVACLLVAMGACSATSKERAKITPDAWGKYNVGTVLFEDKAPETKGSDIYHRIIPMRNRISKRRHVKYWLRYIIRRKIVFLR